LQLVFEKQSAADSVRDSRTLISDFQQLLNTIPVTQIVAGVKAYLRSIGRLPKP